ncbi:MAG TPA: hypothetical protein DCP63_04160 [Bacteroidetes bacterium]|nr:hypothetical protein [Bacteroidota bacterium]
MKRLNEVISNENAQAGAVSLASFLIYLTTMCPGVSFIDCGELATVASTLGIAHPTGYPLFALLGRCVVMIPVGVEEIVKLNLFSTFMTALAVGVFFKTSLALEKTFRSVPGKKGPSRSSRDASSTVPTMVGSLVFGLSSTIWAQSVAVEVYALHLLLILLVLSTFCKGILETVERGELVSRTLLLSSFLLGLSFTNHMTTILLIPSLGYLFVRFFGVRRYSLHRLVTLAPFFFLGLSVYAYVPIRSLQSPLMDWGHPAEAERFFWHVSGKQYRSWIFSGTESAERQLAYFISHFPSEFHWIVIVVLALGIWRALRWNRPLFSFLGIAFLTCVLYSINYDIHDIDSYFILAYIVIGLLIIMGLMAVQVRMAAFRLSWKKAVLATALLILPLTQWWSNIEAVDESDNYLVEDYAQNILRNLDSNSVVLSFQWDYFVSPALYYQHLRLERPDVVVIDKELLRRSWYFHHLQTRYPAFFEQSKGKIDAFLGELYKFEHDLPYDPREIEARFVEMINHMIDKSVLRQSVYVGPEIGPEFSPGYERIPAGLMFRLRREGGGDSSKAQEIRYRKGVIKNRLTTVLHATYVQMLSLNAIYLRSQGRIKEALDLLKIAIEIDPTIVSTRKLHEEISASKKSIE